MSSRISPSKGILLPFRAFSLRLSILVLMVLSIALMSFGRAEAYVVEQARDALADAARPVLEFFAVPLAGMRGFLGQFDSFFDLYAENQRLREEVETLLEWKAVALRQERLLARYESLLNVSLSDQTRSVTARVIGDTGGPFVHTAIVNAGRVHGVARGQAAVAAEGLIGRVVGTGEEAARVLLLTDLNSRMPVLVAPGMHPAILAGDNSPRPRLLYLDIEADIRPGNTVISSDDGGALPRGLAIGSVVADGDGYRVTLNTTAAQADMVRLVAYDFPRKIDRETEEGPPPFRPVEPDPAPANAPAGPEQRDPPGARDDVAAADTTTDDEAAGAAPAATP